MSVIVMATVMVDKVVNVIGSITPFLIFTVIIISKVDTVAAYDMPILALVDDLSPILVSIADRMSHLCGLLSHCLRTIKPLGAR